MTNDEAVAALDAIDQNAPLEDPEAWHAAADDVLLQVVAPDVRAAYMRLVERSPWWATA